MLNVSAEFLAGRKEEKEEEEEEEKEVHDRPAISQLQKQFHVAYHVKTGGEVTLMTKPKQVFKASLNQTHQASLNQTNQTSLNQTNEASLNPTNQTVALTAVLDVDHLWISLKLTKGRKLPTDFSSQRGAHTATWQNI